jgi:glycosyltransferase involved in cell wall biosynthesis
MILICDPICRAGEHVPFNSGMLEIIRRAFPDERVVFLGDQSHILQLKEQGNRSVVDPICWTPIPLPDRHAKYSKRFYSEAKIIWKLTKILQRPANDILLFTTVMSSTLAALKLLSRFFHHDLTLQVVLHGYMGGVSGKRSRNPIRRLRDMKTALTMPGGSRIQYFVLETSIKEAMLKYLPSLHQRLEVIEHSIPPSEELLQAIDLRLPASFGFLGRAEKVRGFPTFLTLASEMTRKHQGKVEFHVIGRYPKREDFTNEADVLTTKPAFERLERHEFIERARKLHFVVFPLSPEFYELSACGSLLDAIAWGKPVIARNIPILSNLFRKYGDIGYLFNDEMELKETIESIIQKPDDSHYKSQVQNMKQVREDRSAIALAQIYREICAKTIPISSWEIPKAGLISTLLNAMSLCIYATGVT